MALLDIRVLGDPVLRESTTPVTEVTPELRALIDDMFETMYAAKGIGLAAPQVGRTERVAVVDLGEQQIVLINPQVIEATGKKVKGEEGCLSIPEIYGDVERPERVVVKALDREGREFTIEGTELLGRCFQHEIDHLDGKLFIDYLGPFKRRQALAKWAKEKEQYPNNIRKLDPEEIARHHHTDEEL